MSDADSKVSRVLAFFEQWGTDFDSMCKSYYDLFTPDCSWANQGFPTTHGPDEAIEKVVQPCNAGLGMDTIRVDILNIGEANGVVYSERIDHIVRADCSVSISIPVTGVMEFAADGRVRDWREYFDSKPIFEFIAQNSAPAS
jgi:limonene-1,2-epoxide hydrolase